MDMNLHAIRGKSEPQARLARLAGARLRLLKTCRWSSTSTTRATR